MARYLVVVLSWLSTVCLSIECINKHPVNAGQFLGTNVTMVNSDA